MLKETFLNKIKERHPDNFNKYDYSLLPNEFKSEDKISIECLIHGMFKQIVSDHYSGKKCLKCSITTRSKKLTLTTEDFIHKARLIHGDKYDYSKVVYINTYIKVIIICPIHGEFLQSPVSHLQGAGCKKCGIESNTASKVSNTLNFITKANEVHNNFYTYPRTDYVNNKTKIIITCPIHGDFLQTPTNHLSGFGCPKCGINKLSILKSSNTEEFIRKARLVHGYNYGYEKVNYKDACTYINIICKIHGDFLQTPNKHLNGQGCPRCKESFGEKYVSQVLDKFNIQYIREYKISEQPYRYDFYLPDYNIYIEYHGIQHYIPLDYFGGKRTLDKSIKRDKVKIELIKRSTGLLITLKYTFNTLEKIEDELLRLFSIIYPQFLSNKELVKQSIIDSNIYLIQDGISYIRK